MDAGRPVMTAKDVAAQKLYDAECALHAAHQSHVDEWITAASDHLHRAIVAYESSLVAEL